MATLLRDVFSAIQLQLYKQGDIFLVYTDIHHFSLRTSLPVVSKCFFMVFVLLYSVLTIFRARLCVCFCENRVSFIHDNNWLRLVGYYAPPGFSTKPSRSTEPNGISGTLRSPAPCSQSARENGSQCPVLITQGCSSRWTTSVGRV